MAITLDASRPKASAESAIALNLALGTVIENDTLNNFFVPINTTNITVPSFTVAPVNITNLTSNITTTGGGFSYVEVGDTYAAVAGLVAGSVVAKIDNNTIRVSASATASGARTITFTPSSGSPINITIAGIEINLVKSTDGKLSIVAIGHVYDGSLKGTPGTADNSISKVNLNQFNINLDSIFNTARIPRTN